MLRFMMLVPVVAVLAGCWWDDAPEIYRVELRYQEENGTPHTETFVCDFRGQSSERTCNDSMHWANEHFVIAANPSNPKQVKIEEAIASPALQFEYNDLTAEYAGFILTAHARKEDRYQMELYLSRAWELEHKPSAKNDRGRSVFIVSDSELREGVSHTFVPAFANMDEAYTRQFQSRVSRLLLSYFRQSEDDDVFLVQATKPITSATVSVTWTPIDEEDITRTDKVS